MTEQEALGRCARLGLHPIPNPCGESGHHTEEEITPEDAAIADALAWFLGTMWDTDAGNHEVGKRTSTNEWERVARALRLHGLRIADKFVKAART